MSMIKVNYDATLDFIHRIRLAKQHEDNSLKNKKASHAKNYRTEGMLWMDAFAFYLQDALARRHPDEGQLCVFAVHVEMLLKQVGDEYKTWKDYARDKALDLLEKILEPESK